MEGTVREIDGKYVLRFERRLNHPVGEVWAALTEPDRLAEWLAEADLDLVEGGRVELRWQNTDEHGNTAVARGTISRLEPPRLLEIDTDIHGLLRWELREEHYGCKLTFTNATPAPKNMHAIVLAGWHIHLDHLADALAGHPVNWSTWTGDYWDLWEELRAGYAEGIGRGERRTAS
jgi:uncharacterized protein YndB with AHSA1/START domain